MSSVEHLVAAYVVAGLVLATYRAVLWRQASALARRTPRLGRRDRAADPEPRGER
jgi:hypothetical protein